MKLDVKACRFHGYCSQTSIASQSRRGHARGHGLFLGSTFWTGQVCHRQELYTRVVRGAQAHNAVKSLVQYYRLSDRTNKSQEPAIQPPERLHRWTDWNRNRNRGCLLCGWTSTMRRNTHRYSLSCLPVPHPTCPSHVRLDELHVRGGLVAHMERKCPTWQFYRQVNGVGL